MNENAKRWVEELRSGKYRQGKGVLHQTTEAEGEDEFCCLGVACKLYVEEHPDSLQVEVSSSGAYPGAVRYGEGLAILPEVVRGWLGLKTKTGEYHKTPVTTTSLSAQNDQGLSFKKIAKTIENEPQGLFVTER